MELDRRYITRRDFPAARRGYDPDEVDSHLRELADAVEDLRRRADRPAEATVAGAAADQVRTIVEAAESSANAIERNAQGEAARLREEVEADARATRQQADAEAAEYVRRVEEATRGMLQRANAAESQVTQLVDGLRATANELVDSLRSSADTMVSDLRSGAEQVTRDLEEMRRGLGEARDARPSGPVRAAATAFEDDEPELETEEPAYEPAGLSGAEPSFEAPRAEPEPEPELEAEDARSEPDLTESRPEPEPEPLKVHGDELHPPDAEPEVVRETREVVESAPAAQTGGGGGSPGSEGARLIALNMALNGTPREETAAYLSQNFDLSDQDALLDEVYSRAGG